MPTLSLPDYLKYFFAPVIVGFYYCIFDPTNAASLVKEFGLIPAIAFLFAGISIYYVYRYLIYNDLIMPIYDFIRNSTHRNYIKQRYGLPGGARYFDFVKSTRSANRIINELSDCADYSKTMETRGRPVRAAAVHSLYQAYFCSLAFMIISLLYNKYYLSLLFFVLGSLQLFTAVRLDFDYEDEELIVIKQFQSELDKAAARLGFSPSVAPPPSDA